MSFSIADIQKEFDGLGLIQEVVGAPETELTGISAIEICQPSELVFVDKKDFLIELKGRRAGAVVTSAALKSAAADLGVQVMIIVSNVALAHALLKQKFAGRDYTRTGWSGIHPSAVIHPTAVVDSSSVIEPRVVIGKNSVIGRNCRLMAGTVVEHDVIIGDRCILHSNVIVGYGCRLGSEVEIEAGTVIGSEGFGFAWDAKRNSHAIPQTGIVVLEDRVRLGANSCIDRATYRETRIKAGTKMDNLCHVAHNVQIGENCLLTAMLCVAGSTTIGDRVMTSGQTGIIDHVNVCADAVLLHRAGVTKDVETPGVYAGLPLQPIADYMKNAAAMKSAAEMRKRIGDLEACIGKQSKT